uniref:Uncharacterized protein n=1 Tax=Trieres chinensis TaxID=1514140 RepID=A0A7S1Z2A4_TRICV|mmetsp:Transcript_15860/g.32570  ORF Transcript_15860/g.32570 Transcript_15860/m.32570 type:complete len:430 (+) Transcript_15860:150-1439(+)|eukprot:CAMPEP_0183307760 /NCGR_PEP_ID=MMETSP0160_2-20130417/19253_1 /TAXON_ID=2839 ORGANISM="Odontella Sinensis, Strain Grunow 1884" /NCGR_SAMPLE_ID=MMETSP0160_2 /ASSEMBLY_ACC=CAM_ASM_000250 /LENGTH=429 /DNA_ID=CAMNT_0025471427 /DNA_START=108 /DNA_END=1397 /DNA_ORIENTATION=+
MGTLRLGTIQSAVQSSREVALLRIESLEEGDNNGLASELANLLQNAIEISDVPCIIKMLQVLKDLATADVTLLEEVSASQVFRKCMQTLGQSPTSIEWLDNDSALQKSIDETHDVLSALMTNKDKTEPFTRSELLSRLPLMFHIPQQHERQDDLQIMVHKVTSEETDGHDTGFVMWPAAVILSRYISENPELIFNIAGANGGNDNMVDSILELGAGCGLVGLTAASLIKQHNEESKEDGVDGDVSTNNTSVIFTDYCTTVLDNIMRNLDLNGLSDSCEVVGLDFFDQPGNDDSKYDKSEQNWIDMEDTKHPQVGLILGADVIAYSNDATNVANTVHAALCEGGKAIIMAAGDNRRFGVEDFPEACRDAGLEISSTNISACESIWRSSSDSSEQKDEDLLHQDMGQTAMQGWDAGQYNLIMFSIDKPISS